jgi:hypothetical protein
MSKRNRVQAAPFPLGAVKSVGHDPRQTKAAEGTPRRWRVSRMRREPPKVLECNDASGSYYNASQGSFATINAANASLSEACCWIFQSHFPPETLF